MDTPAVPAGGGAAAAAAVDGLKTVFLNEFLKQGHARHNEARLRKRRQGINEPAVEYYYDVVNLCRLVDPQMTEARKLGHLFDGLRPTLIERIYLTQPKTCEEFLKAARLLSEAAEVVGQGSWAVNLLAEEKEKQLQAMAAGTEKKEEAGETPTLQQLMAVMQQMQGELVALKRKQGRNRQNGQNGGAQGGAATGPSRSADGKPICFNCQEVGHIRRNCPNKKKEGSQETEAAVGMIRKEGETDIPLLLIDVDQLITEEVEIGTGSQFQKAAAVVDTGAVDL